MGPFWKAFLVNAVIVGIVTWLQNRRAPAARLSGGWRALRPGLFLNGLSLGSAMLSIGLLSIRLLGGIGTQERGEIIALYFLIIMFGISAVGTAIVYHSKTISWKDAVIRIERPFSQPIERNIADVVQVEERTVWGMTVVRFRDGFTLRYPPEFSGAHELLADIVRLSGAEVIAAKKR